VPSRLFGTDGVRGLANVDLTADLALRLSRAAACRLLPAGTRSVALVGRDPRPSGDILEAAVCAGLASAGVDVRRLGVVPTAAVAHLVVGTGAALGVMITASHNPMPDNGIKFFDAKGFKPSDAVEDEIERDLDRPAAGVHGDAVGRIADAPYLLERYEEHLLATLPGRLDGLHVVVDAANGAAVRVVPDIYERAGARVTAINVRTDGVAINDDCGATHLDGLRAAVVEHGADAGIAHDGDADRCLAVDAAGNVVDGDAILVLLALALHEHRVLRAETVAATVMSNLGLHRALRQHGIDVAVTSVGDRYVLERMRADNLSLGGEQSGHVVMLDHGTTGDGVLTALHVLARMAETGQPLADLASVMTRLPQVLVNVRVTDRDAAMSVLAPLAAAAESELGADGRVLVRPSGTEPLVRVMVEATTEETAQTVAQRLAAAVTP
jgi:phosphoglucosamine mutase